MAKRYSTEEIETALHRLALEAGNSVKTFQATGVPEQTLRKWRNETHRVRYEEIRASLEDKLDSELAEDMAALAKQRIQLLGEIGNSLGRNLRTSEADLPEDHEEQNNARERLERELKDLASADRNLATSLGILTQNNRVLRDKPTQIQEQRYSVGQLDQALAALGLVETVESTAIELQPAELEQG